ASPRRGNVGQVRNGLARAVIRASGPSLDIPPDLLPAPAPPPSAEERPNPEEAGGAPAPALGQPTPGRPPPSLEAVERDYIRSVLQQTNWVITGPRGAARVLGLNPSTLRSPTKKLGITPPPP